MGKILIVLLLLMLFGCGGDYDVNVNGSVEVKHTFSMEDIYNYFYQQCRMLYPQATEEELQICANDILSQWMGNNVQNNIDN